MFRKAILAAAVAALVPVAASAAPANLMHNQMRPSHTITIGHKAPLQKITYKTVFKTQKVVKFVRVHGKTVKIVRYVKVPVKVAFINGRPARM
jgi:hypothetical protein